MRVVISSTAVIWTTGRAPVTLSADQAIARQTRRDSRVRAPLEGRRHEIAAEDDQFFDMVASEMADPRTCCRAPLTRPERRVNSPSRA
jgi:hypothetical protein